MSNRIRSVFRNKNIIVGASLLLGVAAVIFIYRVVDIKEVLKTLSNTTLSLIGIYLLIQFTMLSIITWRWKTVLQSQGVVHIPFFRLIKYVMVGIGVSFLTPSGKLGSDPVRAGLLSSREDVKFDKAISSVVIDRSLDITASVTFFVLGMLILFFVFVVSPVFADVLIVISAVLLLAIIVFNYRMLNGKKVFHHIFTFFRFHKFKKLKNFEKKLISVETLIIKFYHKDTKYFYQAISICLLSWTLMFFEYKVAGLMVGQNLNPMQSFLIFSFVGMAYIMPVPMALGTLEASQVSAFSILGISAASGLALSFLVRLKDFCIAITGVIILGIYGVSIKKTVEETKYIDAEVSSLKKNKEIKIVKSKK